MKKPELNDGGIHGLPPADVTLIGWNIIIVEGNFEVFLGFSVNDNVGRLSTPIETYDKETGVGLTRSGSRYQTVGEPSMPHDDAIYVLECSVGKDIVKNELLSDEGSNRLVFKYPVK